MNVAPLIRVCTAAEAAALDAAAIRGGTPGRALMQRAGAAAAAEIARRFPQALHRGVRVLAGPGNNGGDGWVIARALAACGWSVQVWESGASRSADAGAERALALADGVRVADRPDDEGAGILVDALLGTGASGPARGPIADGIRAARAARARGAQVVAIDIPSGVDATTGDVPDASETVQADLTLTFGSVKRGHLVARAACGAVAVLDIGLPSAFSDAPAGEPLSVSGAPAIALVTDGMAHALLPPIPFDAHKGTKRHVAIVGGGPGMAGAVILAARGALRAGAGLVRVVAHRDSLDAVRSAVPQALTTGWEESADEIGGELSGWAHAIAIGPGMGASDATRRFVEQVLAAGDAAVLLDADALNVFAGDAGGLRRALRGRRALLTPHPAEMQRLADAPSVAAVLARRFDIGIDVARATGAAVLLKGVPTVITAPDGRRFVSATGTSALATGGSGDVLAGLAATLLAQVDDPLHAGAVAAWAHGRAAELATARAGSARGIMLDEVLADVANAPWAERSATPAYPVLCELP